jgi:Dolichyl-phosphate-mannose-protein mannosyltransferase
LPSRNISTLPPKSYKHPLRILLRDLSHCRILFPSMGKSLTKEGLSATNISIPFRTFGAILGICGAFVALGLLFIPFAGIQDDEALFSVPIYQNYFEFRIRAFHHPIPLMLMTYVGAVKTALYWPILKILHGGAYSVRLPMLLLGSATIFFFLLLANSIQERRVAWIAALLLASDPVFLLLNTFDWGPVAIGQFLLVTGIFALFRYQQRGGTTHWLLAAGFFCLGLALWNKAIFLWPLAGLGIASAAVCHKEILALLNRRRLGVAAAAFLVGASPFIVYNIRTRGATFRASGHLENPDWNAKFLQVKIALDGHVLFGYLVSDGTRPGGHVPQAASGRVASAIHNVFGDHEASATGLAVWICLLLGAPLWWRSRPARFCLIFCAVTWLAMATTKGAGGAAHHVVLMWPFPHLFLATGLSLLPSRKAAIGLTAFLAFMNLLVMNQYLFQIQRDGPGDVFTDAIFRLSSAVTSYDSSTIYPTDWGMQNPLALLSPKPLKLDNAEGDFNHDDLDEPQRAHIAEMAANPNAIFIGHTPGFEIYPGSRERVARAAQNAGRKVEIVQTIPDSHGRPVFEISRWVPASPAAASR